MFAGVEWLAGGNLGAASDAIGLDEVSLDAPSCRSEVEVDTKNACQRMKMTFKQDSNFE